MLHSGDPFQYIGKAVYNLAVHPVYDNHVVYNGVSVTLAGEHYELIFDDPAAVKGCSHGKQAAHDEQSCNPYNKSYGNKRRLQDHLIGFQEIEIDKILIKNESCVFHISKDRNKY